MENRIFKLESRLNRGIIRVGSSEGKLYENIESIKLIVEIKELHVINKNRTKLPPLVVTLS